MRNRNYRIVPAVMPDGQLIYQLIGAGIGLAGFALIWITLGIWPAVGLVLALWGNNMELRARRIKP